jgi:hypothetical protein
LDRRARKKKRKLPDATRGAAVAARLHRRLVDRK